MLRIQEFSIEKINEKIKELRLYRGYRTRGSICKELGITRESWNRWELNRSPTIESLTRIANHFKINILYFFINNADIEDFDLLLTRSGRFNDLDDNLDSKEMPFTETRNTKQIFTILDSALERKELFALDTVYNTGTTTAILEYRRAISKNIILLNRKMFQKEWLEQISKAPLLIVEEMEKFHRDEWDSIFSFAGQFSGSLVITGKEMATNLKLYGYDRSISEFFLMKSLAPEDFKKIAYNALPECNAEIYSLTCWLTKQNLKKLENLIFRIFKLKELDPGFSMSHEYLLSKFYEERNAHEL